MVVTEAAQRLTCADGGVVEFVEGELMVYRAVSGTAVGSLGTTLGVATSRSGMCVRQGVPLRCDRGAVEGPLTEARGWKGDSASRVRLLAMRNTGGDAGRALRHRRCRC